MIKMRKQTFPFVVAREIRLLVLDVDGVLTDGGLYYDPTGLTIKRFDVQDGLGMKVAKELGLEIALITGMRSAAAEERARDLKLTECHSGVTDKISCLDDMRQRLGLEWEQVAFMGDDWLDMAPMLKVGLPLSVPNAQPEIRRLAYYVTKACGGHGAVREVLRQILNAQGKLGPFLAENTKGVR